MGDSSRIWVKMILNLVLIEGEIQMPSWGIFMSR
jgi:hypothetical protein